MLWVWLIGGVVVGIPALLALVGALLPVGHQAVVRADFRQSPVAIWAAITDFESMPTWRPELQRVERKRADDGAEMWVEHSRHGEMPIRIIEQEAPRRLVGKIIADKLPFGGTWTFAIEPTSAGAALTITEDGEIYNPIFRALARFAFGYHATAETYLKNLGRKFGESALPVRIR